MGTSVFGPNDHHIGPSGHSEPGLGADVEADILARRGLGPISEPPAKAALRAQAADLAAKAKQLSLVERELEKEKAQVATDFAAREADLAAREAVLAESLKGLEG